jgi:hypothetical protein
MKLTDADVRSMRVSRSGDVSMACNELSIAVQKISDDPSEPQYRENRKIAELNLATALSSFDEFVSATLTGAEIV